MQNKYSIGQMAKMFNLSVKTLRYYDDINLFKPQFVNEKTGYRYYTADQIEHLDTILFLKILGMPLKKIKKHLDNPVIDDFLELLIEQQKQTEKQIEKLKDIHKKFQTRIDAIEEIKRIEEFNKVIEKRIEKRHIVLLKENFSLDTKLDLLLKKLDRRINVTLPIIIGNVLVRMSQENMKKGIFNEYCSVGMLLESTKIKLNLVEEIPESDFVCIWFKGTHDQAHIYYKILLDYINEHNYTISGNSIERTISNQFITKNTEYHITGIEIPIVK